MSKFSFMKAEYHECCFLSLFENGSKLGLWHRPRTSQIAGFKKEHGVTLVVSIQGERERPQDIKKECGKHKLAWVHLNINGANTGLLRSESGKFVKCIAEVY